MTYLDFALTVVGVVYTITRSKIGLPIRILLTKIKLEYLSTCPFCMGFSMGLLVRVSQLPDFNNLDCLSLVRFGFIGCFFAVVGTLVIDILIAAHQFLIIQNERFTQSEEE